jgi:hypothetical protein
VAISKGPTRRGMGRRRTFCVVSATVRTSVSVASRCRRRWLAYAAATVTALMAPAVNQREGSDVATA